MFERFAKPFVRTFADPTIDSTIGEILADEQGRAVLAKYVPADVLNSPQVEMAKGMTLRIMAPKSQGLITDEILQSIDEDLRKR